MPKPVAVKTRVVRFLFTGGPHGGKTSLLKLVATKLAERGFLVVQVTEAASDVIQSLGAAIHDIVAHKRGQHVFQVTLTRNQFAREYGAEELAEFASTVLQRHVVMLFDRGLMDGAGFVPDETTWNAVQEALLPERINGETGRAIGLQPFDRILHLRSCAGYAGYEETSDKTATTRLQGSAEAAEADEKLRRVYTELPVYSAIPYREDYAEKEAHVLKEVFACVGIC